jgi:predicted nucleic acid-binding protein
VTDAYLAGLAVANGGTLATFDQALATELADAVVLIP